MDNEIGEVNRYTDDIDSNRVGTSDVLDNLKDFIDEYKSRKSILESRGITIPGIIIEGEKGNYRDYLSNYAMSMMKDDYMKVDVEDLMETSEFECHISSVKESITNSSDIDVILFKGVDNLTERNKWMDIFNDTIGDLINDDIDVHLTSNDITYIDNLNALKLGYKRFNINNISDRERYNIILENINKDDISSELSISEISRICTSFNREEISLFSKRLLYNSIQQESVSVDCDSLDNTVNELADIINSDVTLRNPSIDYNDVGGLDSELKRVRKIIEWPLTESELFNKLKGQTPKGVLLHGPPGTGKTLIASAVAGSTNYNIIEVKCSDILQKYMGQSEEKVRQVFKIARENKPCIIFLDEFDALGREREGSNKVKVTGTSQRVVSELLTELDGLDSEEQVKIIAASNRPDRIDPALLRSGRISESIKITKPDGWRDIKEILEIHLRDKPHREDIDIEKICKEMEGFNGGDVERVCKEASLIRIAEAKEGSDEKITEKDLLKGIDRVKEKDDKDEIETMYY
jgi:ATP-dependent 26S proteasome regulatory subunit